MSAGYTSTVSRNAVLVYQDSLGGPSERGSSSFRRVIARARARARDEKSLGGERKRNETDRIEGETR